MRKITAIALFLLLLLSSCVVTENITLTDGENGSSYADIAIDPFFLSVLEDLSTFSDGTGVTIMDDAMVNLASLINSSEESENASIMTDGEGKRYILSFDYSSLTSLLKDLNSGKENTLLSLTSSSVSFNLSLDNYSELKSVIPLLSDENFEVYGPEYSFGMTEDEYYDMISFLLGEEGPEVLKKSYVTVSVTLPGTVKTVSGAVKSGENSITYTFPVIDFLLLNTPLSFSAEWN